MYYDGGIYHSVETSEWASFDKPEWVILINIYIIGKSRSFSIMFWLG